MKEVILRCHLCGNVLDETEERFLCSHCSMEYELDEIFCKVCGHLMFDFRVCPVCNPESISFCVHNINSLCSLPNRKTEKCNGLLVKTFINNNPTGSFVSVDLHTYSCTKLIPLTGTYIFTRTFNPIKQKYYAKILSNLYHGYKPKVVIAQINYGLGIGCERA